MRPVQPDTALLPYSDENLLFKCHSQDIALKAAGGGGVQGRTVQIIDLGAGVSRKVPSLIRGFLSSGCQPPVRYFPVDISQDSLDHTERLMTTEFSAAELTTTVIQGFFIDGIKQCSSQLVPDSVTVVLLLGLTLGQVGSSVRGQLLRDISHHVGQPLTLLLSLDMTQSEAALMAAYQDHPLAKVFEFRGLQRAGENVLLEPINLDHFTLKVSFHCTPDENYVTQQAVVRQDMTLTIREKYGGGSVRLTTGQHVDLSDDLQTNTKFTDQQFAAFLTTVNYSEISRWTRSHHGIHLMLCLLRPNSHTSSR